MTLGVINTNTRIVDELQAVHGELGAMVQFILGYKTRYSFNFLLDILIIEFAFVDSA